MKNIAVGSGTELGRIAILAVGKAFDLDGVIHAEAFESIDQPRGTIVFTVEGGDLKAIEAAIQGEIGNTAIRGVLKHNHAIVGVIGEIEVPETATPELIADPDALASYELVISAGNLLERARELGGEAYPDFVDDHLGHLLPETEATPAGPEQKVKVTELQVWPPSAEDIQTEIGVRLLEAGPEWRFLQVFIPWSSNGGRPSWAWPLLIWERVG